jgi:putative SOS response-associated peptidase YedK
MCGRYIEVQKAEVIEKRFNVTVPKDVGYKPSYNISPGKFAPVITDLNPNVLQLFQFGLTPFWSKKPMNLYNARSEGDKNKENDPNYTGAKEIIRKPAFRKPIRSRRCLVVADAFIEGPTEERLDKPYVVYLKNEERPFAFAGIWDIWENKSSGEVLESFSIITTVANELLQKIPHHRSPVILPKEAERAWLNPNTPMNTIVDLLKPYPSEYMNAYPISKNIKNPKADGRELIEPVGERIVPETETNFKKDVRRQGMGNRKKR